MAVAFIALIGVGLGALVGGGAAAEKGVEAMASLAGAITNGLLPVLIGITNKIKGDPVKIEKKVDILLKIVKAAEPMFDVAKVFCSDG